MSDIGSQELITISVARLKELEDLEKNLNERVEEAIFRPAGILNGHF